jgi:mono/diheme cytochrome c family protein
MRSCASLLAAVVLAALGAGGAAAQSGGDPSRGATLAARQCARCHAVAPGEKISPVPGLATFRVIANTPGMTGTALAVWLRTPHKEMPNLVIEADDRADLIAYILSLRDPAPAK